MLKFFEIFPKSGHFEVNSCCKAPLAEGFPPLLLEDADNGLTTDFRALLEGLQQDLIMLNERVNDLDLDKKIKTLASSNTAAKRLQQIPGIALKNLLCVVYCLRTFLEHLRARLQYIPFDN